MWDSNEIKNLSNASREEQLMFFRSFDHALMDMDGVIWVGFEPFSDAPEFVKNLKKIGKRINFVTNNATVGIESMYEFLQKHQFPVKKEDVVSPIIGFIEHLKSLNFNKLVYVVGSQGLKVELAKAGFELAPDSTDIIDENIPEVLKTIADNEDIGAVIVDFDINLTLLKLQKCLTYLKRSDCLFIIGTGDKFMPFPENGPLLGNHYFLESLKDLSGRTPYQLAKPSSDYNNYIVDKFSIKNPERVLFIGDSINEDMGFASVGGYQKLLVLTGSAQEEDILNWKHGEDIKPDYYIESIGALNLILSTLKVQTNVKKIIKTIFT